MYVLAEVYAPNSQCILKLSWGIGECQCWCCGNLTACAAVIRPVFEYCVPVWRCLNWILVLVAWKKEIDWLIAWLIDWLTKAQNEQTEALQKRAIRIILNFTRSICHIRRCYMLQILVLWLAEEMISRLLAQFFVGVTQSSSYLHQSSFKQGKDSPYSYTSAGSEAHPAVSPQVT